MTSAAQLRQYLALIAAGAEVVVIDAETAKKLIESELQRLEEVAMRNYGQERRWRELQQEREKERRVFQTQYPWKKWP